MIVQIIVFIQLVATTALREAQSCGFAAGRSAVKQPLNITGRTLCLGNTTGSDRYQGGGCCSAPYSKRNMVSKGNGACQGKGRLPKLRRAKKPTHVISIHSLGLPVCACSIINLPKRQLILQGTNLLRSVHTFHPRPIDSWH